jgi:hypothetical protein
MTPMHFYRRRPRNCRHGRRHGVILFVALLCLLIVMTILGQMLKTSMQAQRQLHPERDLRQTELLLQAGADRAAYRLAKEKSYSGETWHLPADAVAGTAAGQVTIQVSRGSTAKSWHVHVLAEYPLGGALTIRRSQTFQVETPSSQTQE